MSVDAPAAVSIRVASVPSGHPYVENLPSGTGSVRVVRLPDPAIVGAPAGQWWPPAMLDADWVAENSSEFDAMHVHFGMESFSTAQLEALVDALRAAGKPLIFTIHDLVNPQLVDQTRHLEHLSLLVGAADSLITLTPGAADHVAARWGRRPLVAAHPHLWPLDLVAPSGRSNGPLVLGAHLRDLRPNIDGAGTTAALIGAVEALRGRGIAAEARIHLRDRVRDADGAIRIERLIDEAGEDVVLIRSPRFTEEELAETIADLDVSVLPYGFGTHSGWVELCFDLGVPVAGPPVGFIHEQHASDFAGFDPADASSLADAVSALVADRSSRPGTRARAELIADRRAERADDLAVSERIHLEAYSVTADTRIAA